MTDTPEGRDGSPSVAALAIHVNGLRRDVEDLAAKIGGVVARHTDDDETPSTWFWLTMNDQEREEKSAELRDWVETVLREQYPGYLAGHIRPCWPNHPEAKWELAWLYHLWSAAYLTGRPQPKDAGDWHDRWLPGVARRLSQLTAQCHGTCQRQPAMTPGKDG
jgi:hypothetical protein